MKLFRQSLALDLVDRSNLWVALLLLLLSLITWLLPLAPVFFKQVETQGSTGSERAPVVSPSKQSQAQAGSVGRYTANCWCPAQFTQPMVDYAHSVCESSFNFIAQGGNASDAPARLHELNGMKVEKQLSSDNSTMEESEEDERPVHQDKKQTDNSYMAGKVQYFLQVITPTSVFLLAVCLLIPYFVWTLLTSLFGGINVDQTLTSANEGSKLDHESRRQLHTELFYSANKVAKTFPSKTSTLYLFLKLLMCIAAISEAVVVHNSFLTKTRELRSVPQNNNMNLSSQSMRKGGNSDTAASVDKKVSVHMMENPDKLLFCTMQLRILQQMQIFEMQCLFRLVTPLAPKRLEVPVAGASTSERPMRPIPTASRVFVYECLYLMILTVLIALAVTNVTSFLVWLAKLACRPCQDSDLPLDVYFLLQMARENAGLDFVTVLSCGELRHDSQEGNDIELKL